jgi:hypothetical protein
MSRIAKILLMAAITFTAAYPCGLLAASPPNTSSYEYIYPQIKGYGGVVDPGNAAELPRENTKVVFDIKAAGSHDEVLKALDRVALNINLYSLTGVKPDQLKFAVVLHGDATKACLKDEAYARHTKAARNPNLELISRLRQVGVEFYVCLQALAYSKYGRDEVAPDVTIAAAASTVNINKQMEGYAYLPFH